jgi:hypothetical protein
MIKYPGPVMRALRDMDAVVDLEDYSSAVDVMYRNNVKRSSGRTPDMVLEHTRRGYGAEIALMNTGLFEAASALVEDADANLDFGDRMRDLTCCGVSTSVKTMKDSYRYFYVSPAQRRSIMRTRGFCELMLVLSSRCEGVGVYRYRAMYLIDNDAMDGYVVDPPFTSQWGSKIFRAEAAERDGKCVIFKKWVDEGEC